MMEGLGCVFISSKYRVTKVLNFMRDPKLVHILVTFTVIYSNGVTPTEGMYLKNQSRVQLLSYHVLNHFMNIYDWMPIFL